jgi:hypothetical protein
MRATYPGIDLGSLSGDEYYGLWLNRRRAQAIPAAMVRRAVVAALAGRPDPLLVDAESERGGLAVEMEVARQELEAIQREELAKMGAGMGVR